MEVLEVHSHFYKNSFTIFWAQAAIITLNAPYLTKYAV